MHDVLEQVDNFLNEPVEEEDIKQELFDRLASFILELEPDSLSDDQLDEVVDILDQLEFDDEVDEAEVTALEKKRKLQRSKFKRAKKSSIKKKQYSRKYSRRNRTKIRKKRVLFSRSGEGRKRKKLKKRMARNKLTPTGRRKVRYHKTKGGQGGTRTKTSQKIETETGKH